MEKSGLSARILEFIHNSGNICPWPVQINIIENMTKNGQKLTFVLRYFISCMLNDRVSIYLDGIIDDFGENFKLKNKCDNFEKRNIVKTKMTYRNINVQYKNIIDDNVLTMLLFILIDGGDKTFDILFMSIDYYAFDIYLNVLLNPNYFCKKN